MSPGNQEKLPPVDLSGLPPGPRWPVLVQTSALLRFRHRFHPYLRRTYGEVFTIRLAPGGRPLVMLVETSATTGVVLLLMDSELGPLWHE